MRLMLNPLDSEPHFQLWFSSPSCLGRLPRGYCVIQGQRHVGPPMSCLYLRTLQLEEQERLQREDVCPLRCGSGICGRTATPAGGLWKAPVFLSRLYRPVHLPIVDEQSAHPGQELDLIL